MPLYYFHISSGSYCSSDDVGVNLSNLGEAHWYALKLIFKMRAHLSREDDGDWIVKVTDETGAMPLAVLSSSVPWRPVAPRKRKVFGHRRQDVAVSAQETGQVPPNVATEDGAS